MKSHLLIIWILIATINCYGKAELGLKYVWAIKGLNIRSSPSIKAKVVSTLAFGDSLTVIELINNKYSITYIDTLYKWVTPINFTGNWVKIKAGKIKGFAFNVYLLDIPCPTKGEKINDYGRIMADKFGHLALDISYAIVHGQVELRGSICAFSKVCQMSYTSKEEELKILEKIQMERNDESSGSGVYFTGC